MAKQATQEDRKEVLLAFISLRLCASAGDNASGDDSKRVFPQRRRGAEKQPGINLEARKAPQQPPSPSFILQPSAFPFPPSPLSVSAPPQANLPSPSRRSGRSAPTTVSSSPRRSPPSVRRRYPNRQRTEASRSSEARITPPTGSGRLRRSNGGIRQRRR